MPRKHDIANIVLEALVILYQKKKCTGFYHTEISPTYFLDEIKWYLDYLLLYYEHLISVKLVGYHICHSNPEVLSQLHFLRVISSRAITVIIYIAFYHVVRAEPKCRQY